MPSHTPPSYRRPLNQQQILLLQILYTFRFATTSLITKTLQTKHTNVISKRLKMLVDQSYIGMNYDPSYKLLGKPATYYLRAKGVAFFKEQPMQLLVYLLLGMSILRLGQLSPLV